MSLSQTKIRDNPEDRENTPTDSLENEDPRSAQRRMRRRVIQLTSPALAEMVLVSFVGVVDMIMVGRLGSESIAAVGVVNQVMMLAFALFQALNVGTTALVARFIGAQDKKSANKTAYQSLIMTTLIGFGVSAVAYMIAPWVLEAMGAEPQVITLGIPYMHVVAVGLIFNALAMGLSSALRGAGDTKTPMAINMTANVINVVGNYVLIYGKLGFPAMGIVGAGLATSFSRLVACVAILVKMSSRESAIHISLRQIPRINWPLLRRILNVGMPASIEQLILRTGQLTYVRVVASLGTTVFAAHQISMNILSLSFMPGMAFAVAATTLVGQELGAGRETGAERSAREARKLGMMVSGFMAIVFFFFGSWIARLYTSDPAVVQNTANALKIIAMVQPAQSTQFILAGGLRGAGDTKFPLYSALVGIWGVRVLAGYVFAIALGFGLIGAWIGMALDQLTRSLLIYLRFRGGKWKTVKV